MEAILPKIGLIFLIVTAAVGFFQRIRVPGIVALIVAGILVGPHGFGLLEDQTQISMLADLGIILLMFSIGLDFDRDRLLELRRAAGVGFWQIAFCMVVVFVLHKVFFAGNWEKSLFYGMLVSHTSSTLMLKIYGERGEVSTAPARLGLGVSITQDLASVPMLISLPFLAYGGELREVLLSPKIPYAVAILAVAAVVMRWVVPSVLQRVVQSRSRELILYFLMLICLGAAWSTQTSGLSGALGAFIAGLALAGSHYSHQIHAEVSPLRDLLVSLFFVAVGMLLNLTTVFTYAHIIVPALVVILIIKFFSGFLPVLVRGYPLRIATSTGMGIAQIGEFSFILALQGLALGLFSDVEYQIFIIIGVFSMLLSPFLIKETPRVQKLVDRLPFPETLRQGRLAIKDNVDALADLKDHVLIAGFGLNGRNLTRALKTLNIPHAAIEIGPDAVADGQKAGDSVFYGDCTRPDVLRRLKIDQARVFVVAISDAQATRRAVQVARHENRTIHIVVRTRYVHEIEHLLAIGANEVIPEEFETSLEILARTLHEYQIPRRTIDQAIMGFRSDAYGVLRQTSPLPDRGLLENVSLALELETAHIGSGYAAVGKTLKDLALPSRTGIFVLAIRKGDQVMTPPPADYVISEDDRLILVGTHQQLLEALDLLEGRKAAEEVEPPPNP